MYFGVPEVIGKLLRFVSSILKGGTNITFGVSLNFAWVFHSADQHGVPLLPVQMKPKILSADSVKLDPAAGSDC